VDGFYDDSAGNMIEYDTGLPIGTVNYATGAYTDVSGGTDTVTSISYTYTGPAISLKSDGTSYFNGAMTVGNVKIGQNILGGVTTSGILFNDGTNFYPNGITFGSSVGGVGGISQWGFNFDDGGNRNSGSPGIKLQFDARNSYGLMQIYGQKAGDPYSYYTLYTITDQFNLNIGTGWGNGDVNVGSLYVKGDSATNGS